MQAPHPAVRHGTEQASVAPLELFFDLVFVFALTQVTAFMADDLTWIGVLHGTLIVLLLWWSWIGYAWIANVASPDQATMKALMLVAMAAMFLIALCIPEAFDDGTGGLLAPLVLAVCYLVFRLMHLGMFFFLAGDDDMLKRQLLRFTPSVFGATILLVVASQFTGWMQTTLWVAALAVDYLGTALAGSNWRLPAPGHFAERHGLILIVALGESIVAIGVGVAERPISWAIVVASVFGLLVASVMWWAYFDVSALQGEHALSVEPIETRPRLGRNAYTFAHLPLIIGVVFVALGLKKVLEYVSDTEHHTLSDPLKGVPLAALFGGVIIYLLGHVLFKWITVHALSVVRLGTSAVLLVAGFAVGPVPALGQLIILAVILVVALVVEAVVYADARREIRRELAHH
ncbi:MAG TPA: low temperature requirement protein A [Microlunatus sp.]|nr:low temperature requirement protein A [Microlunatus sp.]